MNSFISVVKLNFGTRRTTVAATSELPAFLTSDGGLNSGFMMAHVTAAALGKARFPLPELTARVKGSS